MGKKKKLTTDGIEERLEERMEQLQNIRNNVSQLRTQLEQQERLENIVQGAIQQLQDLLSPDEEDENLDDTLEVSREEDS